jgi:hypothetical protein
MPRLCLVLLLALPLLAACDRPGAVPPEAEAPRIETPAALLAAMHDRYAATRFQTLTFVQQTVLHRPDGRVDSMTWYEAMVPGKLRIDVAPIEDSLGFDLAKLRADTWNDRPAYVVGADSGDVRARQFWVDREHLYAVRLIEPVGPDGSHALDVHFGGYQPAGDAWIESEIMIYVDGTLRQEEHYTNIRPGVALDPALFDTTDWRIDRPYWEGPSPGQPR